MKTIKRTNLRFISSISLLLMLLLSAPSWAQEEGQDLAMRGDKVCTECHDNNELMPILSIAQTKHGTLADQRTPTCISCHGDSMLHREDPDEVKPEVNYNKPKWTIAEQNESCTQCHQDGQLSHWSGSLHDARDVACVSCHTMHAKNDDVMVKETQPKVCYSCHKDKRVEMMRPSRHPVNEGKMACSDCHNPHGSAGAVMMVRDTVVDTCYQCHMEKRGPFIWNHQPVTEDCTICHNPHGSTVDRMLKVRAPFLCQQCHEPTSHRGVIPSGGSSFTQARACLNCHTNIHGGSNPTDSSASRSFRQ